MLVLALDTATPTITAGIVELLPTGEMRELASRVTTDARAHAEKLIPQILECCHEVEYSLSKLDAVVVGCGPGPFTGLRVGMATAISIGDAAGIPVYGCGTLDAIAVAAATTAADPLSEKTQSDHTPLGKAQSGNKVTENLAVANPTDPYRSLLVVTDARRREVYYAEYDFLGRGQLVPRRIKGPSVGAIDSIDLPEFVTVAGDPEKSRQLDLPRIDISSPTPQGLVALMSNKILDRIEPQPLKPLYLRRPDAMAPKKRPVSSALTGSSNRDNLDESHNNVVSPQEVLVSTEVEE